MFLLRNKNIDFSVRTINKLHSVVNLVEIDKPVFIWCVPANKLTCITGNEESTFCCESYSNNNDHISDG